MPKDWVNPNTISDRERMDRRLEKAGLLNYQTEGLLPQELAARYAGAGISINGKSSWFKDNYGFDAPDVITDRQKMFEYRAQMQAGQAGGVNAVMPNLQIQNPRIIPAGGKADRPQNFMQGTDPLTGKLVSAQLPKTAQTQTNAQSPYAPMVFAKPEQVQKGEANWTDLSTTDRAAILKNPDFYKNNEILKYTPAQQQEILADTNLDWKQLPKWQQAFYSFSSNPYLMSTTQGALMGAGGGAKGVVFGGVLGALGVASKYDPTKEFGNQGDENNKMDAGDFIRGAFGLLNFAAEQAEKGIGVVIQGAQIVTDNDPNFDPNKRNLDIQFNNKFNLTPGENFNPDLLTGSTWNAGASTFEAIAPSFTQMMAGDKTMQVSLLTPMVGIFDMFTNPEKYKGTEYYLGAAQAVQMQTTFYERLNEAEQRIKNGENYRQVATDMQTGIIAQLGDMVGQGVADPLNIAGEAQAAAGYGIAKITDNKIAAAAFADANGLMDAQARYKNIINTPGEALKIDPNYKVQELGALGKFMAGLNKDGQVKAGAFTQQGLLDYTAPKKNLRGAIDYLTNLTPESRARVGQDLLLSNVGRIMSSYFGGTDVEGFANWWKAFSQGDMTQAADLSNAMAQSPEFYTVLPAAKDFDIDAAVTKWKASDDARQSVTRIADILGENPTSMLEDMAKRGTSQQDFTRLQERLAQAGTPEAKALLKDIQQEKFTVDMLADTVKLFSSGDVPYHPAQWMAQTLNSIKDHYDNWAVQHFNLDAESKKTLFRVSSVLKSAQSVLLLGANPGYMISNVLPTMVTRAMSGVWGYMTPSAIDSTLTRMGFDPKQGFNPNRLDEGVGPGGMVEQARKAGDPIREATRGKGILTKIENALGTIGRNMPFNKLSRLLEGYEGKQAGMIGMMKFWGEAWRRGKGFRELPRGLAQELAKIAGPRATEILYSAIEAGMNKQEILNIVSSAERNIQSRSLINEAVQEMNLPASKAASLLEQAGVFDALDNSLKNAKTDAQIDRAFERAKQIARVELDQQAARDAVANIEHIANRMNTEGMKAITDVILDTEDAGIEQWMQHYQRMGEAADAMDVIDNPNTRSSLWSLKYAESNAEFRRHNAHKASVYLGVLKALGQDTNPTGRALLANMAGTDAALDTAYRTMRSLRDDHFAKWNKDWDNPRRQVERTNVERQIEKTWAEATKTELENSRQFGELLAQQYEQAFGIEAGEAARQAWEQISAFRKEMTDRRDAFRKTQESARDAGVPYVQRQMEAKKFWGETYKYMIVEMQRIKTEAIRKLDNIANQRPGDNQASAPTDPTPPTTPPVTQAAQDFLNSATQEGAMPAFITNNLRKIASDNGITITDQMTAADVVQALQEKANSQPAETAQPTTPAPDELARLRQQAEERKAAQEAKVSAMWDVVEQYGLSRADTSGQFGLLGALAKPEYGGDPTFVGSIKDAAERFTPDEIDAIFEKRRQVKDAEDVSRVALRNMELNRRRAKAAANAVKRKPMSILQAIAEYGGIDWKYVEEVTREKNPPLNQKKIFSKTGKNRWGLDEMARLLADDGYPIDLESPNDTGGVQQTIDLIQRAFAGDYIYSLNDAEKVMAQAENDIVKAEIEYLTELRAEVFDTDAWHVAVLEAAEARDMAKLNDLYEQMPADGWDEIANASGDTYRQFYNERFEATSELIRTSQQEAAILDNQVRAEAAIREQQAEAELGFTRAKYRESLTEVFGLNESMANAVMDITDARANAYGDAAEWYRTRIADVQKAGGFDLAQEAFHGSPYKFDRFTLEKIGSGEGAQAYGWGLYFAGDKAVAEWYRKKLSDTKVTYQGKDISAFANTELLTPMIDMFKHIAEGKSVEEAKRYTKRPYESELQYYQQYGRIQKPFPETLTELPDGFNLNKTQEGRWSVLPSDQTHGKPFNGIHDTPELAVRYALDVLNEASDGIKNYQEKLDLIDSLNLNEFSKNTNGQLYKVDIPDDKYLLWDKTLSEQPESVKQALMSLIPEREKRRMAEWTQPEWARKPDQPKGMKYEDSISAGTIYQSVLSETFGGDKAASIALKEAGINGIRYYDGNSRGDGTDLPYVVAVYIDGEFRRNVKRSSLASAQEYLTEIKAKGWSGEVKENPDINYNYVIFDDQAIQILDTYYQMDNGSGMLPGMNEPMGAGDQGVLFGMQPGAGGKMNKMDAGNARSVYDLDASKTATDTAGNVLTRGDIVETDGVRHNVAGVNMQGRVITTDGKLLDPASVTRVASQPDMFGAKPQPIKNEGGVNIYAEKILTSNARANLDIGNETTRLVPVSNVSKNYKVEVVDYWVIPGKPFEPVFKVYEEVLHKGNAGNTWREVKKYPNWVGKEGDALVKSLSFTTNQPDMFGSTPAAFSPKGGVQFLDDGRAIIRAFNGKADVSTIVHELGHIFRRDLQGADLRTVETWAGVKGGKWDVAAEEKFARGFERYLADGSAPTPKLRVVFEQFKGWMLNIYRAITGSPIDIDLTPQVKEVFDRLLIGQEQTRKIDTNEILLQQGYDPKAYYQDPQGNIKRRGEINIKLDQSRRAQEADAVLSSDFAMKLQEQKRTIRAGETKDPNVSPRKAPTHQLAYGEYVANAFAEQQKIAQNQLDTLAKIEAGELPQDAMPELMRDKLVKVKSDSDITRYKSKPVTIEDVRAKYEEMLTRNTLSYEMYGNMREKWTAAVEQALKDDTPVSDAIKQEYYAMKKTSGERMQGAGQGINELFQMAEPADSPAFRNWFGDSKVVDENGRPLVVYHGSTFNFDSFTWKDKGNPENHFGRGYYFTNNDTDVRSNYAGAGPDLTSKVERTAENILNDYLNDMDNPPEYNSAAYKKLQKKAEKQARKMFNADAEGQVYEVFLKIEKPAYFTNDENATRFYFEFDEDGNEGGNAVDLYNAILETGDEYGIDGQEVWGSLNEKLDYFTDIGVTAKDIDEALREDYNLMDLSDDNGNLISSEFIRDVFRNAGYDGFIQDANLYFGQARKIGKATEGVDYGTYHYIVFEPDQVKSVNNRGTFDPTNPNILFQDADPRMPLGGYEETAGWMPSSRAMDEVWSQEIAPLMDSMRDVAKQRLNEPTMSGVYGNLAPETQTQLTNYLKGVQSDMASTKMAASRWGEDRRDYAMLNYNKRTGFDQMMDVAFPYQFFYTRSMMTWAARAVDNPAILANYARIRRQQDRYENNLPERLRGKMRIEAPWMPDWMGDALYIDPLSVLFTPHSFMRPFEQMARDNNQQNVEAERILQEWAADGVVPENQIVEAAQTRSGKTWERALAEAKMRREAQIANPMDFVSATFGPAWYLTTPAKLLGLGKDGPETLTELPITRTARAVDTVTNNTWAEPIGNLIGLFAKPEEALRKKLNLPEFGEYGAYYVDRQLANMVAEGKITSEEATILMVERQGPVFDEARERVKMELAMRVPLMGATYAALNEGAGAGLKALPASLFGAAILPEGELEYRGLKQEWNDAWKLKDAGDDQAITRFFDEHPEYEAYLAKGKEPEERLKSFLVGQIWDGYMALGTTDRKQATAEMGKEFQQSFLDTETRSYDTLSIDTLTQWAQMLNKRVPKTEQTMPAIQNPRKIDFLAPEVTAITDQYYEQRKRLYPDYYDLEQGYYALPKSERRTYLVANPDLKQYWDWKRNWYDRYPDLVPVFKGEVFRQVDTSTWNPALVEFVADYAYSGAPLPAGAYKALTQVWINEGQPRGSLDDWLKQDVTPSFLYGN